MFCGFFAGFLKIIAPGWGFLPQGSGFVPAGGEFTLSKNSPGFFPGGVVSLGID